MKLWLALLFFVSAGALQSAQADPAAATFRVRYERGNVSGHATACSVDVSRYVAGKGLLLTAAHNVVDEHGKTRARLAVEIQAGKFQPCTVTAFDLDLDLALIRTAADPPTLALCETDASAKDTVTLAGSPHGAPVALAHGIVTCRFWNGSVKTAARLAFDHGDSGAPLINAAGKVCGVAVAGVPKDGDLDRNIALFVPLACIVSFLQDVGKP